VRSQIDADEPLHVKSCAPKHRRSPETRGKKPRNLSSQAGLNFITQSPPVRLIRRAAALTGNLGPSATF
jgi:hypothetical protein